MIHCPYALSIGLLVFLWSCHSGATQQKDETAFEAKTNVILMMADDMGYSDLGCYGNAEAKTPHLDQLAKGGVMLTDFHSNGAVCSPTRAALLTGLYPQMAGVEGVVTARNHRDKGMSPAKYTLAEYFQEAGYSTAMFGKWHLGYSSEFGPVVQGFDRFRGFVSGNIDYQSHIDQEGYEDWWDGKKLAAEEGYLTELITDHGIDFIKEVEDKPFFLYLAHGAPHYPYQGPDDPADRTPHGSFKIQGSREDVGNAYQEMIASLDTQIGRLISTLSELKLLENTLVIFCSDNGASAKVGSNAPFRGHKGQLYEGGHRVPAIFYWKGKLQPAVMDHLALSMDIFPTLVELTGPANDLDRDFSGHSLLTSLKSQPLDTTAEQRTVFWRFKNQKAARKGKWKLVLQDEESALYDLDADPRESKDLDDLYPETSRKLSTAIQQWEESFQEEIIAF